jgi:FixJ family two-component response regulator
MMTRSDIALTRRAVLIIDNDPAVRGSLQFYLEIEGFQVRTYACGADLLGDTNIPETGCLVIDYNLSDMNGLDLLSELRCRNINLPAILVTTNPSEFVRARAATAGAVVIEKPLLNEALLEGIWAATGS